MTDTRATQLLVELAERASQGEVADIFVVFRLSDGNYDCIYRTGDLPDMLCQVRGEVIRVQAGMGRVEVKH